MPCPCIRVELGGRVLALCPPDDAVEKVGSNLQQCTTGERELEGSAAWNGPWQACYWPPGPSHRPGSQCLDYWRDVPANVIRPPLPNHSATCTYLSSPFGRPGEARRRILAPDQMGARRRVCVRACGSSGSLLAGADRQACFSRAFSRFPDR